MEPIMRPMEVRLRPMNLLASYAIRSFNADFIRSTAQFLQAFNLAVNASDPATRTSLTTNLLAHSRRSTISSLRLLGATILSGFVCYFSPFSFNLNFPFPSLSPTALSSIADFLGISDVPNVIDSELLAPISESLTSLVA